VKGLIKGVAMRVFQAMPGPVDQLFRAAGRRVFGVRSYWSEASVVLEPIDVSFTVPPVTSFVQETYKWPKQVIATPVGARGVYRDLGVGIAHLNHAVVAGDGRVFDRDHRLVSESLATHDYQAVNFGPRTQRHNFALDGVAIALNWWSGNTNVYHWLRDVFARAFVLTSLQPDTPLTIVGPSVPTPFQQYSFDALLSRFPQARYLGLHYGHKVVIEQLLQPAMPPYVRGCGYLRPEVASFIRETLSAGIAPADLSSPHTYISRARTASRRLVNESEVLDRVTSRVPMNVVRIEEFAWRDQLAAMMSTNVLAGVYGAGLVHMLFTRGGGVVEIHNGDSAETHFSTMAAGCGVPFISVQGGPADRNQDFALSVAQTNVLITALEHMVRRAEQHNS
jgi:capsular polysaccharide biosynthesis protein